MKGARLKRLRTMCFPLCDILEKTKLRGENACQWMLVTEMEGAWLESGKRKVGRGNVRHLDCGGDFMTVFVVKIHKRGILPYGNFISLKKKKEKNPYKVLALVLQDLSPPPRSVWTSSSCAQSSLVTSFRFLIKALLIRGVFLSFFPSPILLSSPMCSRFAICMSLAPWGQGLCLFPSPPYSLNSAWHIGRTQGRVNEFIETA